MIPAQDAALRISAFRQSYADGLADGLEPYFRSLATAASAADAGSPPGTT